MRLRQVARVGRGEAQKWGERRWESVEKPAFPPAPRREGRTERMGADGRYGVGMRWLVLTPSPSPAKLESLR